MKTNKIFITLIVTFFLLSFNSSAQNKSKVAQDLAVKLQQKVLLSNAQTAKIKDVLLSYFQSSNQTSMKAAQGQIESILDKRQKAKYDIIKNDWWNTLQNEAAKVYK